MDYLKEFSEISFLLGYFHQDWVASYDWKENEPKFQPVIRSFNTENSIEVIEQLISEIESFLKLSLTKEELETIMVEELGCEYTPRSQGLSKIQFLEESLKILQEPMEVSKKHFIPRSAFDVQWEKLTEEEKEEYNKRQSEWLREIIETTD